MNRTMEDKIDKNEILKPETINELIEELLIPSGSEDEYSSLDDSDADPTIDPDELESYSSSDADTESHPLLTLSSAASTSNQSNSNVNKPNSNGNQSNTNSNGIDSPNGRPVCRTYSRKSQESRVHCTWRRQNLQLSDNEKQFKGNLQYPDEIMALETPFQFMKFFLTDELFERIEYESILYTKQNNPNNSFTPTKSDIQKYIGICILISIMRNDSIRDYWSDTIGNEFVKNTMSINTFERIRASLHFNDKEKEIPRGQPSHDKLYKIRPVINSLLKTFSSIPMDESLSIDEQMCPTKVRHHLRQYIQNKPHKWGYKLFVLCSVSGFAYNFEIYTGQENDPALRQPTEPDLGASSNVVVRLARNIPKHLNHKVYFDNYYTSLPLLKYLYQQGILSLGTVRRNRIPDCKLPTDNEFKKLPRGTSEEYVTNYDGVDITSVIWKDNKCVTFLSTFTGKLPEKKVKRFERKTRSYKEVHCPELVGVYNKHMGGVDLLDSHLGRHSIRIKSKKWYFRLFYHLLDLAVINAWILYKQIQHKKDPSSKALNQKHFRLEIAKCFCSIGKLNLKRGRPSNDIHQELETKKKRNSKSIIPPKDVRKDSLDHWPKWNDKRNRCKLPGCSGFTFVSCNKCSVFLCFNKDKNCFTSFHE